jgi:hypothetical protein
MAYAQAGQLAARAAQATAEFVTQPEGLRPRSGNPPLNLLVVDTSARCVGPWARRRG